MQPFREMKVWQRGMEIAKHVYPIAKALPVEERFALADQLTRAAVSIPTNIAEGSRRRHPTDFAHFLNISEASSAELDSLLILTVELGYQTTKVIEPLAKMIDEFQRMIVAFRKTVEKQT
jgi:four helix bundle protein